MAGTAQNFNVINELGNCHYRPLKMHSGSQTTLEDFNKLNDILSKDIQSQRERELENQIKVLEENIKAHIELLSQIHHTAAKTLLVDKQMQTQPKNEVMNCDSNKNQHNFSYGQINSGPLNSKQLSSVNGMNTTQYDLSSSAAESVKCMMETQCAANNNDQPTEMQMAHGYRGFRPTTLSHDSEPSVTSLNNMGQQTPILKRLYPANNTPTTPAIQNQNENMAMNTQVLSSNGTNFPQQCKAQTFAENAMVSIGPNDTKVPADFYYSMNWSSASLATRKLLSALFERKVLATHSLTGQQSPAFRGCNKPPKQMLNSLIVADIIFAVRQKCNVSAKEVRTFITTKCADENKMFKTQMNKRNSLKENKENLVV